MAQGIGRIDNLPFLSVAQFRSVGASLLQQLHLDYLPGGAARALAGQDHQGIEACPYPGKAILPGERTQSLAAVLIARRLDSDIKLRADRFFDGVQQDSLYPLAPWNRTS